MKKQVILLVVASTISNVDAAASRLSPAARTALYSGRQVFQSALPKNVSNIAKQNARFRTFGSSKYDTVRANREFANQQFARSGTMMTSVWGQFKNWFNNLFANRSRIALATGTAALGGAATYSLLKNQPAVYAQEEEVSQEPKSRINEFNHFHYQSVFINDASKCPKDKDRDTCTKDDLTYEIKAVETPEDIRLYIKNPRLIFDQSITKGSVFITDFTGKNLILDKSEWPGQETKLQLPERLLPNTPIKYIQISDNEIELILPRIHNRFVPGWFYAQTIDVIKPQKAWTDPTLLKHIKTSDDDK